LKKSGIGVVIPFYGSKEKLFRTLDSLSKQTLAPDYAVLIDDCGPHPMNHLEKIKWKEKLPFLVYIQNECNIGAGLSRNVGMDYLESKVDFLHFLDSDDCMSATFYEEMLGVLLNDVNLVASFSKTRYMFPDRDINPGMYNRSLYDGLLHYRPWATSALIWRRKFTEGVEWLPLKSCEDTLFELSVANKNYTIKGVPSAVLYFYQEEDQLTKMERNKASEFEKFNNRIYLYLFAYFNTPDKLWNSEGITIFVRRNIDLRLDNVFLQSIKKYFFKTFFMNRRAWLLLIKYGYLKVVIIAHEIKERYLRDKK
jgi:glycosyltransferase involved in cell wall biosynthesis